MAIGECCAATTARTGLRRDAPTGLANASGRRVGLHPARITWRNGYIESFNSRVRDEWLNINIVWSLARGGS
jgi:hypothetical protein